MSQAIYPALQEDATKRVLKQRRQLERRIAHLEAINTVLRKELPAKNDQIALLEERIANMSESEQIIAKLEAINLAHRAELSAKNERIAVLEEKISTMSVDLASSRAREDKQRMLIRRLSQDSAMSESDRMLSAELAELVEDYNKSCLSQSPKSPSSSISSRQFHRGFSLPGWVNNSTSNNNNTILEYKQLRRSSQGSAMSVSDDNDIFPAEHVDDSMKSSSSPAQVSSSSSSSNYRQFNRGFSLSGWVNSSTSNNNNTILDVSEGDDDIVPAEVVDDSMKSSSSPSSSSSSSNNRQFNRRFSLPNWVSNSNVADDNINDSTRSVVGGIISNLMKSEKSNSCNNLRVDFPAGGREAHRLRMSGCLRMSDLTSDYSAEVDDETSEQDEEEQEQHGGEEEGGGGGGQQSTQQRRRPPNRSRSYNMGSFNSRLMSSTVVFPKEGDDDNLGFE
jgi:myosin heavy subunit